MQKEAHFTAAVFARSLATVLVMGLSACAGGGSGAVPHAGSGGTAKVEQTVTFRFDVSSQSAASRRRPQYLSPATQSISIVITPQGGSAMAPINAALTPSGPGCASSIASTNCSVEISLDPGSYTATFTTYDGALDGSGNPTGAVLSANQNVSFTVTAGQQNTIGLSLFGLPASIRLVPDADAVTVFGNHTSGYTLIGTADTTFDILAEDADGNLIIGPGSPVYQVTSNGSQVVVDRGPSATQPNSVQLRAPAFSPQVATVSVAVTNLADYGVTCAACSDQIGVAAGAAALSNPTSLQSPLGIVGLDAASSGLILVAGDTYESLALTGSGDILTTSNPPYDSAHTVATTLPAIMNPGSIQFYLAGSAVYAVTDGQDASGNTSTVGVMQILPPYTSASQIFSTTISGGVYLAAAGSSAGEFAFALGNRNNFMVSLYDKPAAASTFTDVADLTAPTLSSVSFGADGSLVFNSSNFAQGAATSTIRIYDSATQKTSTYSFTGPQAISAATTDGSGTLYYLLNQSVSVVAPPYSSVAATTSGAHYYVLEPLPSGALALRSGSALGELDAISPSAAATVYGTTAGYLGGVVP